MKNLSDYKGEDAIIVNGKILKAMGKIFSNKEILEKMQNNPMGAIGDIMETNSKDVLFIVSTVAGEDFNGGNVVAIFMQFFTEYMQNFNNNDFFGSSATTE